MTVYLPQQISEPHQKAPLMQNIRRQLRLVWQSTPLYHLNLAGRYAQTLKIIPTDPWPGDAAHGRLLLDGKMMLGRRPISLNTLWSPKDLTLSQQSQLHSFEWLRDLRAVGDNMARRLARQMIIHWIEHNQNWTAVSWHPDVMGSRLANWIGLYDFFCASADEKFRALFFKSLSRQMRHLARNWEDGATPLHQFYGLYGLIYCVLSFSEESEDFSLLLNCLVTLLQQQILPDGGHISRSPTIQLILLRMLIDLRAILRLASIQIPEDLQKTINKMAPLVRLFRHGDGGLASFDGYKPYNANLIDMILSLADVRGKPPMRAMAMGYERCVTKSGLLLFNAGPSPRDWLPETVESGTGILNFEWSLGRERIVVMGDIILQTGEDQSLHAHSKDPHLFVRRQSHDQDVFLEATYHAMHHEHPFKHRRQLYLKNDLADLRGEDNFDVGAPETVVAIRFVLSPNLVPQLSNQGKSITIRLSDGRTLRLNATGHEEMIITTFSESLDSPCILIIGKIIEHQGMTIKWALKEI